MKRVATWSAGADRGAAERATARRCAAPGTWKTALPVVGASGSVPRRCVTGLIDEARHLLSDHRPGRLNVLVQHRSLLSWGARLAQAVPAVLSSPLGPLHRLHELGRALPRGIPAPRPGDYPADTELHAAGWACSSGAPAQRQQGGAFAGRVASTASRRVRGLDTGSCWVLRRPVAAFGRLDDRGTTGRHQSYGVQRGLRHRGQHRQRLRHPYRQLRTAVAESTSRYRGFFWTTVDSRATTSNPCRAGCCCTPCSIENVYRGTGWARGLLDLIPQIEIVALGGQDSVAGPPATICCADRTRRRDCANRCLTAYPPVRHSSFSPAMSVAQYTLPTACVPAIRQLRYCTPSNCWHVSCGADRRLDYRADRPEVVNIGAPRLCARRAVRRHRHGKT